MSKKTIILTESQVDEICGGNFSYLDGLASKPDMANVFSTEVSAEGGLQDGDYPDNVTTDDIASDMTRDSWPRDARSYGKNGGYTPNGLTEMKKKDWERKKLKTEETSHGNKRLNGRSFGVNGKKPKSYSQLNQASYRRRKAEELATNGSTAEEREKGAKSLQRMSQDQDYNTALQQFKSAKSADKIIQGNKPDGTKIKSGPKISGNGKAHTTKNGGIITPLNE